MHGRVGLVLSGGGAKGAYQVGVIKALAEAGVEVDIVAGASIGALNGAILAASPDMKTAAERLDQVWQSLAVDSPLRADVPAILLLLSNIGGAAAAPTKVVNDILLALSAAFDWPMQGDSTTGVLSDAPLKRLLDGYLDLDMLAQRRPLYVSVYPSKSVLQDLVAVAGAVSGLRDTAPSEFMRLQSLPRDQQKECLMASAALPAIFKRRRVGDRRYSDGGQGGWMNAQGNTPVTPLLAEKCDVIFVSHLSNGSFWRPLPGASSPLYVDLRPRAPISASATDLLGFDATRIPRWIERGYEETMAKMRSLGSLASLVKAHNAAKREMVDALGELDSEIAALDASRRRR